VEVDVDERLVFVVLDGLVAGVRAADLRTQKF